MHSFIFYEGKCIAKDFYATNYNYKANKYMATFNGVATLLSLVLEKVPYHNLRSLSTMVTVVILGLPMVTPLGSEDWLMVSTKFSFSSSMLSSFSETLNGTLVTLAGNVTMYGPVS